MGVLLLAGLAIDLVVLDLRPVRAIVTSPGVWMLFAAFAVTEAVVLHFELGRNAYTVSLCELPLTVGLFFLPAASLAPARVLAGAMVLCLVRRQRPLKFAFNVSVWVLDVAVATVVFQQLHGAVGAGGLRLAVPAFAAAMTVGLVDNLAVNAAIAVTSRELRLDRALGFLVSGFVEASGCAALALVCVGALAWNGWLAAPIALAGALLMAGFHTFSRLRQQHRDVTVLYDFAGELSRAGAGETVLHTVLLRVRDLLRAESVTVYFSAGDARLECARLSGDEIAEGALPYDEVPALLRAALDESGPTVVPANTRDPREQRFLAERGVRDAVLAPLAGDQGLRGVLVIENRQGDVSSFGRQDGMLLQTLATHAAAALTNSRLVDRLNHDSRHDSLTGLANRAHFQRTLAERLDAGGTAGAAVLLMDLDRFKEVNDTLGHHHGDLLLGEIARRLQAQLRPEDLLARLGGDEFAVLLNDVTIEETVATANRLRAALGEPMHLQGVAMEVTASIGVALAPEHGRDAAALLQRADVAMYTAKHRYTGVEVYEHALDGYSPRRLALAGGLRTAIEEGQLSMRYQPQARLRDGVVTGAEALVRWEHPVFGEVAPDEFIALAEQTGQIRELTRFVLDASLRACAAWAAAGTPMVVSVNLSVRNLLEPDLLVTVASLLRKHGVPGGLVTLEITESHLMADPERTTQVLVDLAGLGVRLSVDDFGTGYSSLAYLKQLPVGEVKIDKSFIRNVSTSTDDAAIVEAIIQLAHTLRLEVVAEGVEDEASLARLRDLACDTLQGYHLARPMRAAQFDAWLAGRGASTHRPQLHMVPRQPSRRDPRSTTVVGAQRNG